jgi:uncharacterized BrkB/YihY/UPF0761 family membrane protein
MSLRFIAFIVIALLIVIVVISGSDISGLSFSDLKFFIQVVIGIAVMIAASVVGLTGFYFFGRNLITGAVYGVITGAVLYALFKTIWDVLFSNS